MEAVAVVVGAVGLVKRCHCPTALRGRGGLDEVDEAVQDADFAFQFYCVYEGFVGHLDKVEAHVLEDDDGDVDCVMGDCVSWVVYLCMYAKFTTKALQVSVE